MIFLCENNQYSEMTPAYQMIKGDSFAHRVAAYGMPTQCVDGMDACAVAGAVETAVARARAGDGPSYVEADTYRFLGHYQGDAGTGYRPAEEIARWRERDPLLIARRRLLEIDEGAAERLDATEQAVAELLDRCERQALADPLPDPAELEEDLYATV